MTMNRREFNKLAFAGVPASLLFRNAPLGALAKIDSKIKNVQFGSITYSFNSIGTVDEIINSYVTLGLGETEVMCDHCAAAAGMPAAPARGARGQTPTPDQQAAIDAATKLRAD